MESPNLPLRDIRVLEFTHAVMGPTTGLLLADMGAEVVHIEPPKGDETRRLKGMGTGYFTFFNRNKKSLALDLKHAACREMVLQLVRQADVVVENFGPGTMERLGLGYPAMRDANPRVIYCSLKGFLKGPYENRHAMDEVVQMMGGLAYMTGRPGDPLRAGSSVVDITGGMFGLIGILLALYERERTGIGREVRASLFETTAFLMGQHMAYGSITREPVPPMPARVSAWSVYRIFRTGDEGQVFIGIISDRHWQRFCEAFGWDDLAGDPGLQTNNDRLDARDRLQPELERRIALLKKAQLVAGCEAASVPFAPIARPEDLFTDPQLNASGALLDVRMPDGEMTRLPTTPVEIDGSLPKLRAQPPEIGEHTAELLSRIGIDDERLARLQEQGVIRLHT